MNPGRLDRRITLQERTVTRDNTGGVVNTWADVTGLWAQIPKETGAEGIIADADSSTESRQFRIRFREIRTSHHRISYQSKTYDIKHAGEEGRRDYLLLTTTYTEGGQ
ncbi:MAG: phage head closure protein [Akkermansiaceae bacterium]|nr:phage head closure protein [Akkermansiaceae bacterium]